MKRTLAAATVTVLTASQALAGAGTFGSEQIVMTGTDGTAPNTWTIDLNEAEAHLDGNGDFWWGTNWGGESTGTFSVSNPGAGSTPMISGNIDPVLNVNFSVTNTSSSALDLAFTFTLPISPALSAPTTISGDTEVTLTDTGGLAGASLTSASTFYAAEIDGASVQTLSLTLAAPGTTDASFGPTVLPATPANGTIGIVYGFTLSPGDTAAITGSFTVVPEPGSIALLIAGLGCVARRRR